MSSYKDVDSIFSGLERHVVNSESLIENPYKDYDAGVFIEGQILDTLDDGIKIELCLWSDCESDMSFWDVSVEKQLFDSKIKTDFLSYLTDKGLFLENLKDEYGKWLYCGPVEKDDVYRIQYCESPCTGLIP